MSGSLDPHVYPPVNHQLKLREGIPPHGMDHKLFGLLWSRSLHCFLSYLINLYHLPSPD